MDDPYLDAVADAMPKFNHDALYGFLERSLADASNYIETSFKEMLKLVNGVVTYGGFDVLGPEERIREELGLTGDHRRRKPKQKRIIMTRSSLSALRFKFNYNKVTENSRVTIPYDLVINVPYLENGVLIIKGKTYALMMSIIEKLFTRIEGKMTDGIMVSVIRTPLKFNRKAHFKMVTVEGKLISTEFVVISHLYGKTPPSRSKKRIETGIIHYLCCKYGFNGMLSLFGIQPQEISLVQYNKANDPDHLYFLAKDDTSKDHDLYLKVDKNFVDDAFKRKLCGNILYTLVNFDRAYGRGEFKSIYNGAGLLRELYDPSGSIWRLMLGLILRPNDSIPQARSHMDTHIASVDSFLDDISRDWFTTFGVKVDDIYQLLVYVFIHIDEIMVNSLPQNLYSKRLDIKKGIFIPAYTQPIFQRAYDLNQKTTLRDDDVDNLLRINPMSIENALNNASRKGVRNITAAPSIYGDNWLTSCGIFKMRPDGSNSQPFHPSMAVVESISSFSGDLATGGLLSPFVMIDKNGGIIHPHWAQEADELNKYLPS